MDGGKENDEEVQLQMGGELRQESMEAVKDEGLQRKDELMLETEICAIISFIGFPIKTVNGCQVYRYKKN